MPDEKTRKIRRLSQELKLLKQQRDSFNEEAKKWVEKRDEIHKQIGDLRLEATNARERRNIINAEVKSLKAQRDHTRAQINEKIEQTKQLRKRLRLLNAKKPKQSANVIKKEKEEIEWKVQTTSLTLQEEKPLVKKANRLEIQLNIHQQINDTKEKITELQNEIKAMNGETTLFHTQLSEQAEQSQKAHKKMIKNIDKAKILQIEADGYHQNFVQNKQKPHKIREEYTKVEKKLKAMKGELAETEKKEKTLHQEKKRKKLKAEALKKLKQGEKLTFGEFKLLDEEETT